MLGIQTQGSIMEGADKSTELWQHPLHGSSFTLWTTFLKLNFLVLLVD